VEAFRFWPFEQDAVGALLREGDGSITTVCTHMADFTSWEGFASNETRSRRLFYHGKERPPFLRGLNHAGVNNDTEFARVLDEMQRTGAIRSVSSRLIAAAMANVTARNPVFYDRCRDGHQCRSNETLSYSIRNDCVDRTDACVPADWSRTPSVSPAPVNLTPTVRLRG
jgi:hypothetical protein